MNIRDILWRNEGQVLTPELVNGILAGVVFSNVDMVGYVVPAPDFDLPEDYDDRLVFDQKVRVGTWVADQVDQTGSWGDYFAMGIEDKGEIIAGIVFNNMNEANATAHIAISKASRLVPKLLEHAAEYAFNQCGLLRLTGMVEDSNTKALIFDRHIGWEHEFTMRKAGKLGEDLHVLVLWPDKCQWLKEDKQ